MPALPILLATTSASTAVVAVAYIVSRKLAWSDDHPPMGDWPHIPDGLRTVATPGLKGGGRAGRPSAADTHTHGSHNHNASVTIR